MRCEDCNREFDLQEYVDIMGDANWVNQNSAILKKCPDCLMKSVKTTTPIPPPAFGPPSLSLSPSPVIQPSPRPTPGPAAPQNVPRDALTSFRTKLFWVMFVASILIFSYSLASKLIPQIHLPNFPFKVYIISYALLIFFTQFREKNSPLFLIVVLLNFGFPTFRGAFFSHFESLTWTIIFTLWFIGSNVASLTLFSLGFSKLLLMNKKSPADVLKGASLAMVLPFLFYFGLISPFYLDTIEPGPYGSKKGIEPESYKIDRVYEEVLTVYTVDREFGRRYFLDGKQAADYGTIEGFSESVDFYDKALELIPNFSTAYAEIAYSYASMGRILKMTKSSDNAVANKLAIEDNFYKAQMAIDKAKEINADNPTVFGVETVMRVYQGELKKAEKTASKAKQLAQQNGYSDRVVLSLALMSKTKVQKVAYLKGIRTISPDNAELLNMLGVAFYQVGNITKAKEMFEKAVRLSPGFEEAPINLALVSPDKKAIYKKASLSDGPFKKLAKTFYTLFHVQKFLRNFYFYFLIWTVLRYIVLSVKMLNLGAQTVNPALKQKAAGVFAQYIWIFILTYALFALFIHVIQPVNTISHMFAIQFPFF